MKRALKKREKAVLNNTPSSDDAPADQLNVVHNQAHRRARRQAAMIGLAISMGATSLLVTRQSDQAQAAAPIGSQKAASTIPSAADGELKFAPTKLANATVAPASVPETPVVVEPTAVAQLPGLEAKWQVLASANPATIPAGENFNNQTGIKQQSPLAQVEQVGQPGVDAGQKPSSVNALAGGKQTLINSQPAVNSTAANDELSAQLKAQQEFALNRLQEKSNRLRKSLAELRSEESKDLPKTVVGLTQPASLTNQLPPLTTSGTIIEQPINLADVSQDNLAVTVKQPQPIAIPVQPATATAPAAPGTYEVKPGDTLAAIAKRYNTTVAELVKANNLSDPNQIQVSQQLIIPGKRVNSSTIAQAPVVISSTKIEYPNTNNTGNNVIVNQTVPVSQAPVIAENSVPIAVPTPAVTQNPQSIDTIVPAETPAVNPEADGIGGNTPIPKAFVEIQRPQKTTNRITRNRGERLRSLQAEIQRLQQKYRAQQSGNIAETAVTDENNNAAVPIPVISRSNFAPSSISKRQAVAVPIPVPSPLTSSYSNQPVKPEFRATRSVTIPINNNEPLNPEFLPNRTVSNVTPSRTRTTPPTRLNASESLGRMRGTTVSPQLPPLAAVDQYLPQQLDENVPPPSSSDVPYIWPAKGVLTSGYGWRWGRMHRGIDIAAPIGTPIYASADGVVEKAGWNNGGYGNLVDIRHPDGSMTRYGHNSRILVQAGQQVRQGQQIALMGSTGFSTGSHSHFEIHPSGKGAVNPIAMLPPVPNRI